MPNTTPGHADNFIGLEWGDEGKGRFVDLVAHKYDVTARHNGGPNAGHSVQANGHDIALHQIPSGVCNPNTRLYIASGCVVDMPLLVRELQEVESVGLSVQNRLGISAQASVIQPHHVLLDKATMAAVGTTGKGIGPAYASKSLRVEGDRKVDIRFGEMVDDTEAMFAMVEKNLRVTLDRLHAKVFTDDTEIIQKLASEFDVARQMNQMRCSFEKVKMLVDPDPLSLLKKIRSGLAILLEGAQAWGLDVTYGTPPFVTASNIGVGGALNSTGIPPEYLRNTYGVAKLTPSRVGYGPFVSEYGGTLSEEHCMADDGRKNTKEAEKAQYGSRLKDMLAADNYLEVGIALRIMTGEYGVTSKRPRRLGETDTKHLKAATQINGVKGLYLSKMDVLSLLHQTRHKAVRIVTGYALDGKSIDYIPTNDTTLRRVKPIHDYLPVWAHDITGAQNIKELPPEALAIVQKIEEEVGVPVIGVGTGPERDQYVQLKN